MTAEVKLRTLAKSDATLQGFFLGTNGTFRWFDTQLQPSYYPNTCARVQRISTMSSYVMEGPQPLEKIRFQIDILDPDPEQARAAAKAVAAWFNTIDLASGAQFASPATTPRQFPNFQANWRQGMNPQLQPPAYVVSQDFFVYNDATN